MVWQDWNSGQLKLILSEPVNLTYVGFSGLTFQMEYYSPGEQCMYVCMYVCVYLGLFMFVCTYVCVCMYLCI